jgi:hypothetical protein
MEYLIASLRTCVCIHTGTILVCKGREPTSFGLCFFSFLQAKQELIQSIDNYVKIKILLPAEATEFLWTRGRQLTHEANSTGLRGGDSLTKEIPLHYGRKHIHKAKSTELEEKSLSKAKSTELEEKSLSKAKSTELEGEISLTNFVVS